MSSIGFKGRFQPIDIYLRLFLNSLNLECIYDILKHIFIDLKNSITLFILKFSKLISKLGEAKLSQPNLTCINKM